VVVVAVQHSALAAAVVVVVEQHWVLAVAGVVVVVAEHLQLLVLLEPVAVALVEPRVWALRRRRRILVAFASQEDWRVSPVWRGVRSEIALR
jgi:hypothetical protein